MLQISNDDAIRTHSLASPYFSTAGLTLRGDVSQAVDKDGLGKKVPRAMVSYL